MLNYAARFISVDRVFQRAREHAGFAMVEVIVAAVLFALVAGVFVSSIGSSQRTYNIGRAKTTAAQLATKAMEEARALDYDSLGVVGGDPVGTLAATSTVTLSGVTYTINRQVVWVDEPVPNTSRFTKHYKTVNVTVTAAGLTSANLADFATNVAPPEAAPVASTQSITVVVNDMYPAGSALRSATVNLKVGSTVVRRAVTPSNGTVVFGNLPVGTYDIEVTKTMRVLFFLRRNWVTMAEDLPGGSSGMGREVLSAGENVSKTIRAYVPVRLLATVGGTSCSGTKTVSLTGSWGTQTYTLGSGSSKLFDSINGRTLHPGAGYTLQANCSSPVKVGGPQAVTIIPWLYPYFTTDPTEFVNFP